MTITGRYFPASTFTYARGRYWFHPWNGILPVYPHRCRARLFLWRARRPGTANRETGWKTGPETNEACLSGFHWSPAPSGRL